MSALDQFAGTPEQSHSFKAIDMVDGAAVWTEAILIYEEPITAADLVVQLRQTAEQVERFGREEGIIKGQLPMEASCMVSVIVDRAPTGEAA